MQQNPEKLHDQAACRSAAASGSLRTSTRTLLVIGTQR
jgi:hypothetical protein